MIRRGDEIGALADYLDYLYDWILDGNKENVDMALAEVIQEKRDRKSRQNAECGEQPAKK